jgi:tetratricopeptide (TPR) repeat protein/outer membrane protein OmpA-like peptidoglycan-associated protein
MKFNALNLTLVGLLSIVMSSCDLLKDVTYTVTPNPLELHGDNVKVSVSVNIPEKGIKKKAKVEITPTLGNAKLATWIIQGEKATGNGQTITFKPGGTATFEEVVAYDPSMEASELKLTGKIFKGVKEKDQLPETKIADATVITPLLVRPQFMMLYASDKLIRSNEKTVSAQINFLKGSSTVRPSELNDKDVVDLVTWITEALKNNKITINSIGLNGYASPDGEEDKNEALSIERSKMARKSFMDLLSKAKITSFKDSSTYKLVGLGEDFEGFQKQLSSTKSISESDKDLILRVIQMSNDPAEREKQMITLGKTWTELEKEVFPMIRRSEITINYTEAGWTDSELLSASSSNPASLTVEELLFTSEKLVSDLNEKARIYQVAASTYPSDYRVNNNLGAIKYMQNKLSEAKASLEKANNLMDNGMSKNNLAGVAMSSGDRETAKKLLAQVKDKSDQLAYNNAVIAVLEGNYASAISGFGKGATYNKALAQILANQLDEASKTIAASQDKESADGHYLKAIIASRSNAGVDAVVSCLKAAFAKNPGLKEKAGRDREFMKLMNDATFSAALK